MKLYIDSNVIIALFKEELGRNFRPLFSEAQLFLEKTITNGDEIFISTLTLEEVARQCFMEEQEIVQRLKELKLKIILVPQNTPVPFKPFVLRGIHMPDAVHAALAIKTSCDCLVTFNKKDFAQIQNEITVLEPNDY